MGKRKVGATSTMKSRQDKGAKREKKAGAERSAKPDPRWVELKTAYPDHPALQAEAVYTLPEPLIDSIGVEIPGFFSEEEEQFERALTRASGAGFFMRRPFVYPPLSRQTFDDDQVAEAADPVEEATTRIRQMLAEDMAERGRSELQIKRYFAKEREISRKIEDRRWGYAGWLATNQEFREACAHFRGRWESTIKKRGRFPWFPVSFVGGSGGVVPKRERRFHIAYTSFYRRWGLHSLVTWDLPVPMSAGIDKPTLYSASELGGAGLGLFVPWYLLRDQEFKLHDLARHGLILNKPDHLKDWLEREPRKWGHERFAMMLKLFVYIELCLKRRYAKQLRGNVGRLQDALGRFLSSDPSCYTSTMRKSETVRKIRQEMNKRLKKREGPEA